MTLIGGEDYLLFRSWDHAFWFIIAIFLFTQVIFANRRAVSGDPYRCTSCFMHCMIMAAGYEWISKDAITQTLDGQIVKGAFSPDCIWFNHDMSNLYFGLAMLSVMHGIGIFLKRDADRHRTPDT